MSLQVANLTKQYGSQLAVDDISFNIREGEIVGFLGPNGAGKSTTMKIATGYIPPHLGKVEVCGIDVVESPVEVKKLVGYLPEHNPLYLDMFVHEYLHFVGKLFHLRNLKERVREMIALCGLEKEQSKKIEALSKGYRQRVGLAQALIHEPQVLILDEPTSGLDPNQLVEIRNLIKNISSKKTVLFSTHIMQEVLALCDRVIVINKGKIVADDHLKNLLAVKSSRMTIVIELEQPIDVQRLKSVDGVDEVEELNSVLYRLTGRQGADIRSGVFKAASDQGIAVVGMKMQESSLEGVFRNLTATQET